MTARLLLLVPLLVSCADPKETSAAVRERYVGKGLEEVYQALGYPEDVRPLFGGGGTLVSWYRTADRDHVVSMEPHSGVLEDTCRLTLHVFSGTVVQFQLTGDRTACARFVP